MGKWEEFSDKLEKFILSPDISYTDLEYCLNFLGVDLSFISKLRLKFSFSNRKARSKLLKDSFSYIKEHKESIFKEATFSSISAYDQFLRKFFEISEDYLIQKTEGPKEKDLQILVIKIDDLLQKSQRFVDIFEKAKSAQLALRKLRVERKDEIPPKVREFIEKLNSIEIMLKDRDQKIENLKAQYQLLKKRKVVSTVPSIFLQNEGLSVHQKEWDNQKLTLKKINEREFLIPIHFQNQKEFDKWVQEEEILYKEAEWAFAIFKSAQSIEGLLRSYTQDTHYLRKVFYEMFVSALIPFIEEMLFKEGRISNEKMQMLLNNQKKELALLNSETDSLYDNLTRSSIPFIQQLSSQSFSLYNDLPNQGLKLIEREIIISDSYDSLLTTEAKDRLLKEVKKNCDETFKKVEALIDKGRDRNKKIDEITKFHKACTLALRKLQFYADLKPTFIELKKRIDSLLITKDMLLKESSNQDALIERSYAAMLHEKKEALLFFQKLDLEIENCERSFVDSIRTLKRRLFEIFTNTTPFPDLLPNLKTLFEKHSKGLRRCTEQFFSGNLTKDAFRSFCIDMAYEQDVFQLRNEVSHRARRLSDLRKECNELLYFVQERVRLISIIKDPLYKEGDILASSLVTFLNRLENPVQIFKSAFALENVNETFQRLWIQLEALKVKSKIFCEKGDAVLKNHENELIKVFLAMVDNLEEILLEKTGSRHNLVIPIQGELLANKGDNFLTSFYEQKKRLEERFSFCRPSSFFLLLSNPKEQKLLLLESKKLDEQLQLTREFAKSLQYIKTFEEERVDEILEAFERQYVISETTSSEELLKSAWLKHRDTLMHASEKVEDEVLLDVGLLDIRAINDVEKSNLLNTLKNALQKARDHFLSKDNFFFTQFRMLPEIRKAKGKNETVWLADYNYLLSRLKVYESEKEIRSVDEHLEMLQKFCHLLFEARIFLQAEKNNRTARFALIISELRCFILKLQPLLQNARKKEDDIALPWIPEIHNLRKNIEDLELLEERQDLFEEALLKLFQQKDDIKEIKEKLIQDPLIEQEELLNDVRSFKLFHEGAYLHYLPAQLTYFQE